MRSWHDVAPRVERLLADRWLVVGMVAMLVGPFILGRMGAYLKLYYASIMLPALLGLLISGSTLRSMLREPLVRAFLAFAAWLMLSISWTGAQRSLSDLLFPVLYAFLLFFACALIALRNPDRLLATLRVAGLLSLLAAGTSLVMYLAPGIRPAGEDRLIGIGALRNPLLSSHVFGFFCAYWVAVWATKSGRRDGLALLAAALVFATLLATGSRTPLMALAATAFWLLLFARQRAGLLIAAGVAVAAGILVFNPDMVLQRGVSYRPQIWADALRQAGVHPWLGYGVGTAFVFRVEGHFHLSDPHNVELLVLLQLGMVGLLLWSAMYLAAARNAFVFRSTPGVTVASALVVYGLFAGMTEGSHFLSRPNESWFLIWLPLAILVGLSLAARGEVHAPD